MIISTLEKINTRENQKKEPKRFRKLFLVDLGLLLPRGRLGSSSKERKRETETHREKESFFFLFSF